MAPATAAAQPVPHVFGERGQYVLTTDSRLDYERSSYAAVDADGDAVDVVHTRFDVGFAIDRVVSARRFTVGARVTLEADLHSSRGGFVSFLAGARVGKLFDLGGDGLTLWPRIGLGVGQTTFRAPITSAGDRSDPQQMVRLDLSAPLLWRPLARFFLGGGPKLEYDLYTSVADGAPNPRTLTIGFEAVLGVWFHGY